MQAPQQILMVRPLALKKARAVQKIQVMRLLVPLMLRPTLDPRWMRFLCHPNQQTNQCLSLPKKVSVLVAQNDHQFSPSLHHFDQNFLQAHT
jgi:hypothetical protein